MDLYQVCSNYAPAPGSPGTWSDFYRYLYVSFKQNSGERLRATWPSCYKIDMLFNIYSLIKVYFKMCYCWLSFKAFVFKYKIFSEQYNEIFDLGFYTMCSFRDTESNIL